MRASKLFRPTSLRSLTNGIDTAEFTPSADRRARIRAQMGVGDEFVWLAAGRIVPAKDYPKLLRAFAQVRARMCGGAAVDCRRGAGGWLPRRFKPRRLSLGASVRWLGLRRDMPALLDAADGFALASAWEGMPLAVGEAMAMEKPVVATDVGGVRELVGETGVIVPAKSAGGPGRGDARRDVEVRHEARRALGRAARERI